MANDTSRERLPAPKTAAAAAPAGKIPSTSVHLILGATAGLVSAITLQPLDLLKTRLQQQQKANALYRTSVRQEIAKLANVKDLWRGVLPSALRTSVGAGLYFTILSQSRSYLATLKSSSGKSGSSVLPKLSHLENLASGFVVRAVVGFITMPITIIKTRFESSTYRYTSMSEGFRDIYANGGTSGSARNFFNGTVATLARDSPYAGLYVLFYEGFKNELFPKVVLRLYPDVSPAYAAGITNSAAAVLAASVATAITAPFDAIKTRLQLNSGGGASPSILAVTKQLMLEQGGARNLFSGLSLRLGRKGISAGISWCIYEELLKYL